jgi:tetratricopeptide (TPR) repeat protein
MRREARAMARVVHDNVARVFEIGEQRGRIYVVMEFVRGATLRQWVERTKPTRAEIVERYIEAGRGIAAAHAAGIVHRDFKPDNAILGSDGRVRVLDFGLASAGEVDTDDGATEGALPNTSDTPLTRTGTVLGTPQYMAPEQFRGERAGPEADQFALCVSLFEALFGAPPFAGTTAQQIQDAKTAGAIALPTISDRRTRRLLRVLVRGLAASPKRRWPDIDALLRALDRSRSGLGPTIAIAGGVAASIAVGTVVWRGGVELRHDITRARAATACASEGDLSAAWNDGARARVRDVVGSSRLSYAAGTLDRVIPAIDGYVDALQDVAREVCVAANVEETLTDDAEARAMWCIDERRVAVQSLAEQLARANDDTITHAMTAVLNLPGVDACRDEALLQRLPAPPSERRDAIAEVRAKIGRADALRRTSRVDEALAASEAALAAALAADWPAVSAWAHATLGRALVAAGRYADAEAQLDAAYFLAMDAGAYEVAVDAAADLVHVVGIQLARRTEGVAWVRHGEAALRLLGEVDGLVATRLLERESELRRAMIEIAEAERIAERVLAIRERLLGPEHPLVGDALWLLAVAVDLRDERRASEVALRAVRIAETSLGPDHPDVAPRLELASSRAPHAEGVVLARRAVTISERAFGPDHPRVASALLVLGRETYWEYGEAAARPHIERAYAIQMETLGPKHPEIARTVNLLGMIAHPRPESVELYQRALAIAEDNLGPLHPFVAPPLFNLSEIHRMRGELELALPLSRRAAEVRHHVFGDTPRYASYRTFVGMIARCLGRYDEAYEAYAEVIAIEPHSVPRRIMLADVLLARGQFAEAAQTLQVAIDATPGEAGARGEGPLWLIGDFTQAQLLWALPEAEGRDRARAVTLARDVARRLRTSEGELPEELCGGRDAQLARVEDWLRTHRR